MRGALVGFIVRVGQRCPALKDHPRGCGEHCRLNSAPVDTWGSSPRMRGARSAVRGAQHGRRIIPADAGSTACRPSSPWHRKDHPRGCGEHVSPLMAMVSAEGSSPRMRGAHIVCAAQTGQRRIIPADAGSTPGRHPVGQAVADHPRGCGEHCFPVLSALGLGGSSPRMRGAQLLIPFFRDSQRIIPADAGSTWEHVRGGHCERDHPRGCGEHKILQIFPSDRKGSSPRMRGAPPRQRLADVNNGIIPADAGSTGTYYGGK